MVVSEPEACVDRLELRVSRAGGRCMTKTAFLSNVSLYLIPPSHSVSIAATDFLIPGDLCVSEVPARWPIRNADTLLTEGRGSRVDQTDMQRRI